MFFFFFDIFPVSHVVKRLFRLSWPLSLSVDFSRGDFRHHLVSLPVIFRELEVFASS